MATLCLHRSLIQVAGQRYAAGAVSFVRSFMTEFRTALCRAVMPRDISCFFDACTTSHFDLLETHGPLVQPPTNL